LAHAHGFFGSRVLALAHVVTVLQCARMVKETSIGLVSCAEICIVLCDLMAAHLLVLTQLSNLGMLVVHLQATATRGLSL
jgi:hypothetical protein